MCAKVCRRCLLREIAGKDYEERIAKAIEKLRPADRADEKIYDERLNICRNCDKLNSGTCLSCGCYVEVRAAVTKNRCPDKKW
ncbi:MAG: DUF6171 family protein [Lachnospiraceae bacterium]|nr:DUF6171 family protein [Lachnospiraceae bacterium]